MPETGTIARAIAYFEACDDQTMLKQLLRDIQPRAATEVRRAQQQGRPVPPPLYIASVNEAASKDEALATLRTTTNFAQLQAISRAIGRRIEALSA